MPSKIGDDVVQAVVDAGFDVYMRDVKKDTWLIFTDGVHIGYLQNAPMGGVSLGTVHMPNGSTGTGFRLAEHLGAGDLTRGKLIEAFSFAPSWASGRGRDRASVRKWPDIEACCASNSFNAAYRRVPFIDALQIKRT